MWERFLDLEEAQLRLAGKPGRGRWWPRSPAASVIVTAGCPVRGQRPPAAGRRRDPQTGRVAAFFFLKRKPSRLPRLYSCILINSEELEKAKVKKTKAVQLIYVRKKKGL